MGQLSTGTKLSKGKADRVSELKERGMETRNYNLSTLEVKQEASLGYRVRHLK